MFEYVLIADDVAPAVSARAPFRCLILQSRDVSEDLRAEVSRKLVAAGCLWMMAWGQEASLWDDSVDWANIEAFPHGIPDEGFVMTTWHSEESLEDVMEFAKRIATQSETGQELRDIVVLDFGRIDRSAELQAKYAAG